MPLFAGFLALIYFMRRSVSRLISGLTVSMERIAEGVFDLDIPGFDRGDEVGAWPGAWRSSGMMPWRNARLRRGPRRIALPPMPSATRGRPNARPRAREQNMVVDAIATGLDETRAR